MKTKLRSWLCLLGTFAGILRVQAQGTTFVYQGQLQNGGSPANGLYDFQFSLSDAPSDGSQIGGTVTNLAVGVSNGVFNTTLDFGAVFTGNPVWLAISVRSNGVGTYVALTPLQALTPVPYAVFANTASNLSGTLPATQLSGAVNNSQLANSAVTINPGPGLGGGGAVALGGATTLSNTGVLSVTGNPDITVATADGAVVLGTTATNANTPGAIVKRDAGGNFNAGNITATNVTGSFGGDGLALTNIPLTGLQSVPLTNGQSSVSLNGLTTVSNLAVTGTNFVNNLVVSNAPALDGSAITGLNASQLNSGTVPLPQLNGITSNQLDAATWQRATNLNGGNAALASNVVSGISLTNAYLTNAVITNSVVSGDGSGLTNLNAAQLSSGTLPLAQLPGVVLTNQQSGVSLSGLTTVSNLAVTGTNFANSLVVSNAPALDGSAITNLNASQLAGGTVPLAQLSGITSNQLDAATWQRATNLNGGNAALASNVVSGISLTNAYLTNAVITNSVVSGDGSGLTNLNAAQLSSGTLPLAQLPGVVLTNQQSGVSLSGLTTVSNLAVTGTNFANSLVVSNAPALDGSAITNLNASQLAGGTVPLAQLSGITSNQLDAATWQRATNLNGGNAALASNVVSGISLTNAYLTNAVITNSVVSGDGSGLTNLNAAQLSSGTLPLAQLPGVVLTNQQSGVSLSGLTTVSNLAVTGTNFANSLVVSNAPALDGSAITNLNASQLTTGTVPLPQLSGLTSNQLDAATWQLATNLNGGNAALASNVVSGINLTNAYLTNAIITNSVFAGDGSSLTNVNAANLVGVMTGNPSLSNTYGITNVFDGDSYTRGDGSLPYTMPLGVQEMSGIPSVNFGFDGFTTYQILTNFQSNTWAWSQPNIIWAGNNDQYTFTPVANVVSNIGVMVADMALSNNTRYLVLSVINDYTNQGIGTPVYEYFTNLNAALQTAFTNHYIDIRAWMIQNYDPASPADLYAVTNDSPPTSEWYIPVDHPNALGESLVANKVLENAYWMNNSAPLTTIAVQEQIQNVLAQPLVFGNTITVTTIFPPAFNPVNFTDQSTGSTIMLSPYLEQIWTPDGVLGFNGNNLNNIGALTANSLLADIDGSTNGSGFPPLFSASVSPNDAGALTNLNASQLAGGTVPTAQLPVATASSLGVVQPDGTSITINHGVISASAAPGSTTIYITNAMTDGTPLNVTYPHGLGTFPGFIHPILLCTTNDAGTGMNAGQMTEFSSVTGAFEPVFASVSYDTTNIYIQTTGRAANAGGYQFFPSQNNLRPTSWNNFAIVVGFRQQ